MFPPLQIRNMRQPWRLFCASAAAAAMLAAGLAGQEQEAFSPRFFSELRWRSIRPARGGRSTAVAGSAARPHEYYNRSSQDPLNFPIRLNNKLAALQGAVETGDSRPTGQARAVFNELSARLDAELARIDAAVNGDVAAFSALLRGGELPPVVPAAAPASEPGR